MGRLRFPFTTVTLLFTLAVLAAGFVLHIDLIETPLHLLENFEYGCQTVRPARSHMFHQSVEELSSTPNAIDGLKC